MLLSDAIFTQRNVQSKIQDAKSNNGKDTPTSISAQRQTLKTPLKSILFHSLFPRLADGESEGGWR